MNVYSSIYNEDLSTPAHRRVCSNPRYIYYYDDETIPLQSFLCKFEFSPFSMKFYEKKFEISKMMFPVIQEKNLEINSAARAGSTPQSSPHPRDAIKTSFNSRNFYFNFIFKSRKNLVYRFIPMS